MKHRVREVLNMNLSIREVINIKQRLKQVLKMKLSISEVINMKHNGCHINMKNRVRFST